MSVTNVTIGAEAGSGRDVEVSGDFTTNNTAVFNFFNGQWIPLIPEENLELYIRGGQYSSWTLIKTWVDVGDRNDFGTHDWNFTIEDLPPGDYQFAITDEAKPLDFGGSFVAQFLENLLNGFPDNTALASFTVVNNSPSGDATQSVDVDEDAPASEFSIGVTDPDDDDLSYSVKPGESPSKGSVSLGEGTFTYKPFTNENGQDSFVIVVTDEYGAKFEQSVTVNIEPVNDDPTATDDTLGVFAEDNGPYEIDASSVLSNDSDIDGDSLSVSAVSSAVGGTVSVSGSTITFNPTANYYGPASFTYTVFDGTSTDTATATFNITPDNSDAPSFTVDTASISVPENIAAVGTFVANDPDAKKPIYSLSGAHASYFTINAATGELSFASAPDYETLTVNPLYVTIIAADGDNVTPSDTLNLTVTVTNVVEPEDNNPPEEEPEQPPPNPNPGQEEPDPVVLLNDAFRNIMRYEVNAEYRPRVDALAEQVEDGDMTLDEAIGEIVDWADGTTAVATLAYQFFGDAVPTAAGLDWLVAPDGPNPNSLNEDYYASFSLDSRYINFAVNLGTQGTTGQAFALEYGAMSVDDAAKAIYLEIFGFAADQAKIDALMDGQVSNGMGGTMAREAYLRSISGGDDLGLKAAFAGWLLSYAATADEGVYADANEAFLMDIADGGTYNVDIVGVYAEG